MTSDGSSSSLSINLDDGNPTSEGGEGVSSEGVTSVEDVFTITNQRSQAYTVTGKKAENILMQSFSRYRSGRRSQDPSLGNTLSPCQTTWGQMFTDTRPDDVKAGDVLVNSLKIFADDGDGY